MQGRDSVSNELRLANLKQILGRAPFLRRESAQSARVPKPRKSSEAASGSDTCQAALVRGYALIPTLVMTRWIRGSSRSGRYWGVYLIFFSEWPLVLNVLLYLIHRQWAATKGLAMLWIAGFGLSVALMLIAAMTAWEFATERGYLFDEIIQDSPERLKVSHWLDRFIARRQQLILPIIGAVSAPIYLYLIRADLTHTVGVKFPSYVLVSWVSFVGGSDAYWLWVATGLPKKIWHCTKIKVRWQDPGSTPGLRLLADSYGISAIFLLAGLISISLLGFVLPRAISAQAILYTLYAFFFIVVCTSVRVTIVPLFWMWLIIVRSKRASMAVIDKQVPDIDVKQALSHEAIGNLTAIYQTVSVAPTLPFSTSAMVQYGAAFAGSVFAFIIGLVSSHVKFLWSNSRRRINARRQLGRSHAPKLIHK